MKMLLKEKRLITRRKKELKMKMPLRMTILFLRRMERIIKIT